MFFVFVSLNQKSLELRVDESSGVAWRVNKIGEMQKYFPHGKLAWEWRRRRRRRKVANLYHPSILPSVSGAGQDKTRQGRAGQCMPPCPDEFPLPILVLSAFSAFLHCPSVPLSMDDDNNMSSLASSSSAAAASSLYTCLCLKLTRWSSSSRSTKTHSGTVQFIPFDCWKMGERKEQNDASSKAIILLLLLLPAFFLSFFLLQ